MSESLDSLFRREYGRLLATLIRLVGDFDLAEESLQEALTRAVQRWDADGWPEHPQAWLVTTARRCAIDRVRRDRRRVRLDEGRMDGLASEDPAVVSNSEESPVDDDQLRLIFTCCHPSLNQAAQVALTLRTLCGLQTSEIARAFLTSPATTTQRMSRAKAKIRDAGIPYRVPDRDMLSERLPSVLAVVYLVFNEGYAATGGDQLVRHELCREGIRLGRLLVALLPEEPEIKGLLALMLFQDARRAARLDAHGDLVVLEAQDRSLWHVESIAEGRTLVEAAQRMGQPGPYQVQAAIAAAHALAPSADVTDWPLIVALYDRLLELQPSPVIALNRAVAVAMAEGPAAGLAALERIGDPSELAGYVHFHATRGEILRRVGQQQQAKAALGRALELCENSTQRRHLERRLAQLTRER